MRTPTARLDGADAAEGPPLRLEARHRVTPIRLEHVVEEPIRLVEVAAVPLRLPGGAAAPRAPAAEGATRN
jgi:hypothetical protein